jgi:hypothetical protein
MSRGAGSVLVRGPAQSFRCWASRVLNATESVGMTVASRSMCLRATRGLSRNPSRRRRGRKSNGDPAEHNPPLPRDASRVWCPAFATKVDRGRPLDRPPSAPRSWRFYQELLTLMRGTPGATTCRVVRVGRRFADGVEHLRRSRCLGELPRVREERPRLRPIEGARLRSWSRSEALSSGGPRLHSRPHPALDVGGRLPAQLGLGGLALREVDERTAGRSCIVPVGWSLSCALATSRTPTSGSSYP